MTHISLVRQVLKNKKLSVLLCALLLILPFASQTCSAQATPRLQNKALLFLTEVIGVDMSNYKISLYDNSSGQGHDHLFYKLDPAKETFFVVGGNVGFNFYNDSVGSCSFNPGTINQPYLHPRTDRFNDTLAIMQRYYAWTNDTQVQQMIDLMKKVGSEKNLLEVSGNLSLRISINPSLAEYRFSNYLNRVEYTGVTVSMGNYSGDVFFDDYRVWQKIGNTSINITEDQAISIAEDAVKGYSYDHTFGNGTIVPISNLNVTGVYRTGLSSSLRDDSTLYPLYNIELNVTGLPSKFVGIGVFVWANDGTIQSIYQYIYPSSPFVDSIRNLIFFQAPFGSMIDLLVILCFAAAVIVIVLIVVLRSKKAPSNSADEPFA
jgi:hypothetical protein